MMIFYFSRVTDLTYAKSAPGRLTLELSGERQRTNWMYVNVTCLFFRSNSLPIFRRNYVVLSHTARCVTTNTHGVSYRERLSANLLP